MINSGFLPLMREPIMESEWFNHVRTIHAGMEQEHADKKLTYIMFQLLFKANFKDAYGLKRGQCVVGRLKASKEWDIAPSTIDYNLKKLEKMGEIKCESKPGVGTTITLLKYDEYIAKPMKKRTKNTTDSEESEDENDGYIQF